MEKEVANEVLAGALGFRLKLSSAMSFVGHRRLLRDAGVLVSLERLASLRERFLSWPLYKGASPTDSPSKWTCSVIGFLERSPMIGILSFERCPLHGRVFCSRGDSPGKEESPMKELILFSRIPTRHSFD